MKLDKSAILKQISPLINVLKRYHVFLFIVSFLAVYGFLIIRVSDLTQNEPTAVELSTEQEVIKPLKLDQSAKDKLLELEEQNIEVQALFKQARDNPFTE